MRGFASCALVVVLSLWLAGCASRVSEPPQVPAIATPPPSPPTTAAPQSTEEPRVVVKPNRSKEFLEILEKVLREPRFANQVARPGGRPVDRIVENNCQLLFVKVGEELSERGWVSWGAEFPLTDLGNFTSDSMLRRIRADSSGAWERIRNWRDAQLRANAGEVVIGAVRADLGIGRPYGHLAPIRK
jgi:hypothetical protein